MSEPRPIGEDDLQAALDGCLAPDRAALVEAYLSTHPEAAARQAAYAKNDAALRNALQAKYDEPIPARLRIGALVAARRRGRNTLLLRIAAVLAIFASGAGAGRLVHGDAPEDGARSLTDTAVAAYRTFTVETRHPVEVRAEAGDQLTDWLSTRLDRKIVPPDLAAQGFRLMGGRILPDSGRWPAALLMYDDDHGTRLTVYLRSGSVEGTDLRFSESEGVATFYRSEQDLTFAVSARTNRERLLDIARRVEEQFGKAGPAARPL